MNLARFFETLKSKEIKLGLDDQENIRVVGQRDNLEQALLKEIKEKKSAIVKWLKEEKIPVRPRIVALAQETDCLLTSFAQQRLWFIDQLGDGSAQYNIPGALRVQGRFDEDVAEQVFVRIIQRHEPLRTVFLNGEDGTLQLIRASFDFQLSRIDLSALAKDAQEQVVKEALNSDVVKPFDLSADLMLRASFIRLSGDEGVLLFNMHHIASDGWSMSILVNELGQLYEAFSQGLPDPLAPLTIRYADYAQWQRGWLKGEVLERQLSYWETQLADLPQAHGLPMDRPRPAMQTYKGALHSFGIDRAALDGLKQVALRYQSTLFMVLHGVFTLLLSRYANSNDIVIGTPMANRPQKELESLVGFFVNMLVLRTDCSGDRSFRDYLKYIKSINQDAQANQDVPFEYLVERLNPRRSASHAALFQIMLSLNTNETMDARLKGLKLTPLRNDRVAVKYDIALDAIEQADGLRLSFAYNRDLFNAATIVRMGEHLNNLLRGVVANSEEKIHVLPMLTKAELDHLLYGLNETATDYPRDICLHELFEAQVERSPELVAVVFGEQRLSYRELNEKAGRLARYLAEAGVGVESRVGIYLRRSPEMMIGVLGVMKAGGAYVPLEPGLPKGRVGRMMEDAGIEWALADSSTVESLPLGCLDVVLMDGAGTDPGWLEEVEEVPLPGASLKAENLAYILYTSGSTGRPKGVMVTHWSLSNYLDYAASNYLRAGIEGSVVSSPLCFDATLTTLLPPLLVGKEVELLPEDETTMSRLAERLFAGEEGRLFKITPAHLEVLEYVERPSEGGRAPHVVVVGGEQLPAQRLLRWKRELLPEASFVNEYGPTEAVVGCSVWRLSEESGLEELEEQTAAPIGRPIGNTRLYVLGEGRQLQPRNSVGELYIGGEGLSRGYLNQEELTREKFIPNPFSEEEGSRLYRTGDLARRLPSGELLFVGRRDEQVKIRGFRIELGEIEQELVGMPGVKAAVVTAREDEAGQRRLVAYVAPSGYPAGEEEQAAIKPELISGYREALAARLPEYMAPAHFVLLEALPLTPSGKVDRKALPTPEGVSTEGAVYVAPRNETERALCEVWQEVINREQISVLDNFFSLGGDSILSIRVVAMLRRRGVALTVKDVFQYQTIERLAAQVRED